METFRFAPGYELPAYPFVAPPDLGLQQRRRYPVVIVGAGLSGLTLACDLALRGVRAVVLDEDDTIGVRGASSRGIVYAQKSLEIFERLGTFERIRDKGVTWSVGRTLSEDDQVYSFNRQTDSASCQPPFINLQQFYLEWFLVDRIHEIGCTDLRWKNRVARIDAHDRGVVVSVDTPAGSYELEADWLIDASGANSPIREQLGLDAHASRSADRWCITDVRFAQPLPVERWTWVDAPFNDGRAVWQHLMADHVWRLDYQMAPDADPHEVSRIEVAGERLRRHLGPDVDFEFVWIGPYMYRDHLLDEFRHGRVFFIGDSAHVVSPFGARGGNTGIQDAINLGWKLALVLQAQAPESLLDSYSNERHAAAAENLQVTSATARFLAPRSPAEFTLRRALLALAHRYEFARPMVNTGRMSVANDYPASTWLPTGGFSVQNVPIGLPDGREGRLNDLLRDGTRFAGLWFAPPGGDWQAAAALQERWPIRMYSVCSGEPADADGSAAGAGGRPQRIRDPAGALAAQVRAAPGGFALIRPDAYCAARIEAARAGLIEQALRAALGGDPEEPRSTTLP